MRPSGVPYISGQLWRVTSRFGVGQLCSWLSESNCQGKTWKRSGRHVVASAPIPGNWHNVDLIHAVIWWGQGASCHRWRAGSLRTTTTGYILAPCSHEEEDTHMLEHGRSRLLICDGSAETTSWQGVILCQHLLDIERKLPEFTAKAPDLRALYKGHRTRLGRSCEKVLCAEDSTNTCCFGIACQEGCLSGWSCLGSNTCPTLLSH